MTNKPNWPPATAGGSVLGSFAFAGEALLQHFHQIDNFTLVALGFFHFDVLLHDRQLTAISFGDQKPKALGHDEDAWRQNRRDDLAAIPASYQSR